MKNQQNHSHKKIAWDIRYGLPNQQYLEFVTRFVLQQEGEEKVVDPFAIDLPEDRREGSYVVRDTAEQAVGRYDTQIIIGLEGSGKTTLFRRLPELLGSQCLVVNFSLPEITGREHSDGPGRILTIRMLARNIFNTFWDKLLRDPLNFPKYLPQLRRDRHWMSRLRWFYQQYPPLHSEISDDFELMTWLRASSSSVASFNPDKADNEDTLQELLKFVTSKVSQKERYGSELPSQPFSRLVILVDGTEAVSGPEFIELTQDAQNLYNLDIPFKLFTTPTGQGQIQKMSIVRQGRIPVYQLPPWSAEKLYELLQRRLEAHGTGEFHRYDWGKLLLGAHLKPTAKLKFVDTIVSKTIRPSEQNSTPALPSHALRLARGLVAACAGCWAEQGFVPPLGVDQLETLAEIYWQAELGGI